MKVSRTARRATAGLLCILLSVSLAAIAAFATRPDFHRLDDYPDIACTPYEPANGRVFHIDPHKGSDAGDGSAERPWKSFSSLQRSGLIGDAERRLTRLNRLVSAVLHVPPRAELQPLSDSRVRGGDTVVLAGGDYGEVDLSGIVNTAFITVEAAPGADVRFSSLDLAGASHFAVRGITISASRPATGNHYLVTTYDPAGPRSDNIVFDRIDVSAQVRQEADAFSADLPDGVRLAGDCLALRNSEVHHVASGVNVMRSRHTQVTGSTIRDFTVDGVQFSGRHLLIRDNAIYNQYAAPGPLHPDCMQGQPPYPEDYGPVAITHNRCIRALAGRVEGRHPDRFGWQGINIFNGRWQGVTIACNLVIAGAQHGIALYGADTSLIERNIVRGGKPAMPSWIAALPSADGRQPVGMTIRHNRSTGFLNAVSGDLAQRRLLIASLRVNPKDRVLNASLLEPITGVSLDANTWLTASGTVPAPVPPGIMVVQDMEPESALPDTDPAKMRYPLPAACAA